MTGQGPTLHDLADGALSVEYPELSEQEANARALADARALEKRPPAGLLDAVVGARTLYLEFDPKQTSSRSLARLLAREAAAEPSEPRRTLRVPVFYGGSAGADLEEVARDAGLSSGEFARRHAQAAYRVAFLGFAPGFAYLTGLPGQLHCPRLPTPRTSVPAGAVAIGGPYTGIYPGGTPGGWRLIGRAGARLFDPGAHPPALLLPGDQVFFEPVTEEERVQAPELSPSQSADAPLGPSLFLVLSAGVFSSVQGAPRYGWSRYGVAPGGAMDREALGRGNQRLGNPPDAPALEMTFVGAELEVLAGGRACLAGADPECEVNGRPLGMNEAIALRTGDRLRAARIIGGARSYLCVEGGLAMPQEPWLSPRLKKGDILCGAAPSHLSVSSSVSLPVTRENTGAGEAVVRVVLDPRGGYFPERGIATFLSTAYRVSASSDRRGIRLEGASIELDRLPDIPPEGTPLGGIQVARDGMPIVLGPDRPITGGYARIATVIRADFPLLAQALPGSPVRFVAVDLAAALAARVG